MNILLALKLTSDANMVSDTLSIRNVLAVEDMHLLTDFEYKTEIGNVKYHYLPKLISRIPLLRLFYRIPVMLNICRKNKIDLLICFHLTSYGLVGFIVSKILGIPISMHFLGKDLDVLCRNKYFGKYFLRLASKMDMLTVQGHNSKKFLEERGTRNVSVIPTVCDVDKFEKIDVPKEYDLIFVGRLSNEKRPDRFVDIVKILFARKKDVKAAILGSGPLEGNVRKQIQIHNLDENINFIGWSDQVQTYLSKSRIFVLTSDSDQLPLALLEAMASGLVPVASNVGNLSDVVNSGNGYLLEKDDLQGFSDAIIELLDNQELYRRKAGNAVGKVKEFSIDANTQRWAEIFHERTFDRKSRSASC